MKKIIILLIIIGFCEAIAELPNNFTYQAVLRDNSNNLIVNTQVGLRISIVNSLNQTIFSERHETTSNANGLVTLKIGSGAKITGSLSSIDWNKYSYRFKIEIDPEGGYAYNISGFSDILPVPISMYATKADTAATLLPKYKIGDELYGGIVFYVDETGQHGLIAAKEDIGTTTTGWLNTPSPGLIGAKGVGIYAGFANTMLIVSALSASNPEGTSVAKLCFDYQTHIGNKYFGGWYLPSVDELMELCRYKNIVGGFQTDYYWSSSEVDVSKVYVVNFASCGGSQAGKGLKYRVRAIRAF